MSSVEQPEVIEFVRRDDPKGPPLLYACGRCGTVYSPRTYTVNGDAYARRAAEECYSCRGTDRPLPDPEERRLKQIAKAVVTKIHGYCFSDSGDGWYADPEEAADAGERGVFGAKFTPFRLDPERVIEMILDDHHEDASENDLDALDELLQAVATFNARQTGGSYQIDCSVWQPLPQRQTFAMIKPDATARGIEDHIIADIERAGFTIAARKRKRLAAEEAEWLYAEHRHKDHFRDLVAYTISGDVVLLLIEGASDDVPGDFRRLMGPTRIEEASPDTLRGRYAIGLRENSIHGSDGSAAAAREIGYFAGSLQR